jgi:DNA-binding protein HU-beta
LTKILLVCIVKSKKTKEEVKKMSVTKKELAVLVAKKANLTSKAASEAVKAFLNGIRDSLKRGERVVLSGFGTFKVKSRKARKGRNPKTGETITIAARKAPSFTPGKTLKRAVK